MNACTCFVILSGFVFTLASTFYLLVESLSESPKTLDIPYWFVQGMIFYIKFKPVIFKYMQFLFQFLQVIGPITFCDYKQVIDVCSDKLETTEHFVHLLPENIQGVTHPYWYALVPVLSPRKDNGTQFTILLAEAYLIIAHI